MTLKPSWIYPLEGALCHTTYANCFLKIDSLIQKRKVLLIAIVLTSMSGDCKVVIGSKRANPVTRSLD